MLWQNCCSLTRFATESPCSSLHLPSNLVLSLYAKHTRSKDTSLKHMRSVWASKRCLVFEKQLPLILPAESPTRRRRRRPYQGRRQSKSTSPSRFDDLVGGRFILTTKADKPSILIPTEVDNQPAEETTMPCEAQLTMESSRATVASTSKPHLPLTDSSCLLVDSSVPSPPTAEISSVEKALRDASAILKIMNLHDTWRKAFTKI